MDSNKILIAHVVSEIVIIASVTILFNKRYNEQCKEISLLKNEISELKIQMDVELDKGSSKGINHKISEVEQAQEDFINKIDEHTKHIKQLYVQIKDMKQHIDAQQIFIKNIVNYRKINDDEKKIEIINEPTRIPLKKDVSFKTPISSILEIEKEVHTPRNESEHFLQPITEEEDLYNELQEALSEEDDTTRSDPPQNPVEHVDIQKVLVPLHLQQPPLIPLPVDQVDKVEVISKPPKKTLNTKAKTKKTT